MSHYLPKDLIMNIFLRLPSRSTVRFRCLSRSWYAFLSQRDFIYQNLIQRHAHDDHDTDLFVLRADRVTENLVYSVVSAGTLVSSPIQDFPVPKNSNIMGTHACDGLICYYYCNEDGTGDGTEDGTGVGTEDGIEDGGIDEIVVWNPATGEAKILPPLRINSCASHTTQTLGFGFDAQNNDYKIVNLTDVTYPIDNPFHSQVEAYVYSLKGDNCWRKLPVAPDFYFGVPASLHEILNWYKNGTFYLLAGKRGIVGKYRDENEGLHIISFDMTTEVFESTPVVCPPSKYAKYMGVKYFCSFFPLKESIAAVVLDHECVNKERSFEIWALLQPGVTESWTKLYDLEWLIPRGVYWPVGYWRNHFIFHTLSGQLLLCDPSHSEHETQTIQIDAEESLPFDEASVLETCGAYVTIFPYKPSHILL